MLSALLDRSEHYELLQMTELRGYKDFNLFFSRIAAPNMRTK